MTSMTRTITITSRDIPESPPSLTLSAFVKYEIETKTLSPQSVLFAVQHGINDAETREIEAAALDDLLRFEALD